MVDVVVYLAEVEPHASRRSRTSSMDADEQHLALIVKDFSHFVVCIDLL